ncbi:MAG: DUF3786 domain-containing protein [Deltaproteobacteria bacterium]|nr:DUF3786 domain-containing protein [Deltaproteobacteria bacterium]
MFKDSDIFEKHYEDYMRQIGQTDVSSLKGILKIDGDGDQMTVPFFDRKYSISKNGILDGSGNRPHYMVCVILAKYILHCPDRPHDEPEWVSFKDFKRTSHFLNVNFFRSDTEHAIEKSFSGRKEALLTACENLGGHDRGTEFSYDISMAFEALPRVSLLLLFNDADDEFPAQCKVLFQKHSEFYLDPESLIMTGTYLSKRLQGASM